jgi:hypothetical protein
MIRIPLVSAWYPEALRRPNYTLSPAETLCPRGDLNSEDTGVTRVRRSACIAVLAWVSSLPGHSPLRSEGTQNHPRRYLPGYLPASVRGHSSRDAESRKRAAACAQNAATALGHPSPERTVDHAEHHPRGPRPDVCRAR